MFWSPGFLGFSLLTQSDQLASHKHKWQIKRLVQLSYNILDFLGIDLCSIQKLVTGT